MTKIHYTVSPSALERHMTCHASFMEERKYPKQPSGPSAIDGTHTHTLIEQCINDGLKDPVLLIGHTLVDHEGEFTVDFERAKRALVAINYVKKRKAEMGVCAVRAEEESDPGKVVEWDDWKGTCDITLVGETEIEIIDYKDGRTPKDPVNNPQLMSYGLGRLSEYAPGSFEYIRLTIIQPRCNPPISHHVVTDDRLYDFANEVIKWRKIAESDNPPFNPGEKQCRWCNARGGCSALMNQALEGVGMGLQAIDVANQAAEKEPTKWTDEQLREFIEGIPLLKQAIEAAQDEALRRFKNGHAVAGLKPVEGRGSRQWKYDEVAMTGVLKKMGVPKSSMYVSKLISPAQAEKLYWEKRDGTRKTLSERQLRKMENEYIERKPGKITIVPESDEREAVELGVEKLFKPIESAANELPAWLIGE